MSGRYRIRVACIIVVSGGLKNSPAHGSPKKESRTGPNKKSGPARIIYSDRLFRRMTFFHGFLVPDLVSQSCNLPVLKGYFPVVGDEQDAVIGYGFFTIGCADADVVRLQADIGAIYAGAVTGST